MTALEAGPVLVGTFPDGSPEWHAARAQGLGGSDMAAVLGLSPWESPRSLWHRKRGELDEQPQSDAMSAGHRLEPVVRDWFHDRHPRWAQETGGTYRSAERPWQIANPDVRLNVDTWRPAGRTPDGEPLDRATGLECKFSLFGDGFGESGTDDVPVNYRCQTTHYCDVMGWPGMWLAVFIGARGEFREYWLPADPQDVAILRARGEAFVASLADGPPPPLDGSLMTLDAVRFQHPDIDRGTAVEIPADLALDWHAARADLAEAEDRLRRNASAIHEVMAGAQRGLVDGRRVVMRSARGGRLPFLLSSIPTQKGKIQ